MSPLLQKLTGGDRRQTGNSNKVIAQVLKNPNLFTELFSGLTSNDPLVRMRAADAVEKISRQKPSLLKPHKKELLKILSKTDEQEVAWHCSLMAPRLTLTKQQCARVWEVLKSFLGANSRIQRVTALKGLVDLTAQDASHLNDVKRIVKKALMADLPSVRARARMLQKQLSKQTP